MMVLSVAVHSVKIQFDHSQLPHLPKLPLRDDWFSQLLVCAHHLSNKKYGVRDEVLLNYCRMYSILVVEVMCYL